LLYIIVHIQVCSAGSRLIVQETVAQQMILKLKERMSHLRIGDPLDKCIDMGALVDQQHLASVAKYVEDAKADGAEVLLIF
jgi:aldehyde dehydrogenase (NAD+)